MNAKPMCAPWMAIARVTERTSSRSKPIILEEKSSRTIGSSGNASAMYRNSKKIGLHEKGIFSKKSPSRAEHNQAKNQHCTNGEKDERARGGLRSECMVLDGQYLWSLTVQMYGSQN